MLRVERIVCWFVFLFAYLSNHDEAVYKTWQVKYSNEILVLLLVVLNDKNLFNIRLPHLVFPSKPLPSLFWAPAWIAGDCPSFYATFYSRHREPKNINEKRLITSNKSSLIAFRIEVNYLYFKYRSIIIELSW